MNVHPAAGPLEGEVRVPGDKSIGHRALMFAALAEGRSRISGLPDGEDVRSTRHAIEAFGVKTEDAADGAVIVEGAGMRGLRAPAGPVDCGNSGTTVRLLSGVVAGRGFDVTFVGDASLSRRPMNRVAEPLRRMGAVITGREEDGRLCLPLTVGGDGPLEALHYVTPVASAQVKSCVLLAGLRASGVTAVTEPAQSRDHTETMLAAQGVAVARKGLTVSIEGPVYRLAPLDLVVPGDPSSAAFLVVAGLLVPGSHVEVKGVCLNPTRVGFVDVLRRMGAAVTAEEPDEAGGEVVGTLTATAEETLVGTEVRGHEVPRLIDEVPILAVAAALADGDTRFRDCAELRVKESDRIAAVAAMLRAFGVEVDEAPDGFTVHGIGGRRPAGGAVIEAHGDHRIAMAAAILGLVADGETEIRGAEAIASSFPGFGEALAALGG
jgi:3-phosphoshikimate 1-carboxyvinyltransferase